MLILSIDGSSVLRGFQGGGLGDVLPSVPGPGDGARDSHSALKDWASRYGRAVEAGSDAAIQSVGTEMFDWLNQNGVLSEWLSGGTRELEVRVGATQKGELAEALLDAPWEVLCRKNIFLAEETALFSVARRVGRQGTPVEPQHRDLSLMFMAAAPDGQHDLDYEREESAILDATRAKDDRPPIAHLQVEESGALEFLDERLTFDGPFDALHLSCHGGFVASDAGPARPVLFLETAEGAVDQVDPDRLVGALRDMPLLMFLSACRTAERGTGKELPSAEGHRANDFSDTSATWRPALAVEASWADTAGRAQRRDAGRAEPGAALDLADPFVRQLARHVPNILGWDGSVYDIDATAFAEAFYGELSRGDTVPMAAARARQTVLRLRAEGSRLGRHWHLARLYLGPAGGGRICDPQKPRRKVPPPGEQAFLDPEAKLVKVAGPGEFVGRRRQIQRVMQAYRDGARGVVVHGMGNLGKSSLAARVAGRMRRHRVAVVFGEATPTTIFAALKRAGEQVAAEMKIADGEDLREDLDRMERIVASEHDRFGAMAQSLLAGVFDDHPVLLVLDDFEQSLVPPSAEGGAVMPAPDYAAGVSQLLHAFAEVETQSRLLVTTRYDFVVKDGTGKDLAAPLTRVPLAPMGAREQIKQVQAKARAGSLEEAVASDTPLLTEALDGAGGNPGLQDVLTRPILAGEPEKARAAVAAIREFRESGETPPAGDDLGDFFQRMAFETYIGALGQTERLALGAAGLFAEGVPVPRAALAAAAGARGVSAPELAVDRLLTLGLIDDFGEMRGWPRVPSVPHLAANPLARPLGEAIAEAEAPSLAAAALPQLAQAWQDDENDFPYDARGVEAARIALAAEPADVSLLDRAAKAAVIFLYRLRHDARAAFTIGTAMLDRLEALGHATHPLLSGHLINAAGLLGETDIQERLIDLALAREDLPDLDRAQFWSARADRCMTLGDLVEARRIREEEELPVYQKLKNIRLEGMAKDNIADILQAQGDLAEARRIREEETLPVYEGLGDRRSVALTRGKIADILQAQGDLAEARRIREEEQLPVLEALGDRRSVALTRGQIADILQAQGDLAEALEMHLERLPTYREMGDVGGIAHVRFSCAQIRWQRGHHQVDGGLQEIHNELAEAFEINQRLQRPDGIGVVGALLGEVLAMAGQPDRAIEVLSVAAGAFHKIGRAAGVQHCQEIIQTMQERDQ